MRLIDADNLVPDICDAEIEYGTKPVHFSANAIDLDPTVDAVPVVRCLDCGHGMRCVDGYVRCSHPSGKSILMKSSDFCSYGERKEGVD